MSLWPLSALLVAASVYLAPSPAASQDSAPPFSFEIVTPSRPEGRIDIVVPVMGASRVRDIDEGKLPEAFLVYAEEAGSDSPMAGEYEVASGHIRFIPRFPLREGVTYVVAFNENCAFALSVGACIRKSRPDASFKIGDGFYTPLAKVATIEPQTDELPTNLLRFYVHFTEPMAQGDVYDHISLVRSDDTVVDSPFLNLSWNLWDDEQKRLTVLLDPGRIKRGVGPNFEVGPPLVEGETYTITVNPGLQDAHGRPLSHATEKTFTVASAVHERLDPLRWTIQAPRADSRKPLRVVTEAQVDSGRFEQSIAIVSQDKTPVTGTVVLVSNALEWQFVPDYKWAPGNYRVVIQTDLEDVSGNSVRSALDAVAGRAVSHHEESVSRTFSVSAP